MFQRNRIYIQPEEQEKIKNCKLLIAGAGLGSNIAECALRIGFENITICDMDNVEQSNLNRQNYTNADIGTSKSESLFQRLKAVNPEAQMQCNNVFLTQNNSEEYIKNCNIAINTIDFTSEIPFIFDDICIKHNVPVLHPFNLGWAGCLFVINKNSRNLQDIVADYQTAEQKIVEHIINNCNKNENIDWLTQALQTFKLENGKMPPPQLAPASWLTAGICTNLLYQLTTNKPIKVFPDFYFLTTL